MKECRQRNCGIGGQAVIEGVMMRNRDRYAIAVRKSDGSIVLKEEIYKGILAGSPLKKIPFVRGVFVFIDSMILGLGCTNYSADIFAEDDPESVSEKASEINDPQEKKDSPMDKLLTAGVMVISLVLALGLFMVLPYFLASRVVNLIGNSALLSLFEGVIRIAVFVCYILAISQMKDVRRLFQYHGAEHKCINCIEAGDALTVENAQRATRLHKRCGSSFILFVMMVGIVLFFFIRVRNPIARVGLRILLLPVISGISYELIRFAGSSDNPFIAILSKPGLWLQGLTTKEPDEKMLEVAIASVEAVFDWRGYLESEKEHHEGSC